MATVISELFDESGMSVQAFADKAGLKYGTAYDIAKGVSKVENIGAGAFVRIAHVFGKTADELLSDIPNDENSQTLSNEEWALISNYRRCSSGVQDAIRNLSISFAGVPDEAQHRLEFALGNVDAQAHALEPVHQPVLLFLVCVFFDYYDHRYALLG